MLQLLLTPKVVHNLPRAVILSAMPLVTSLEDDQILLWVVKTTTMVGPWPQIVHEIMTFRALKTRAAATKPILSA